MSDTVAVFTLFNEDKESKITCRSMEQVHNTIDVLRKDGVRFELEFEGGEDGCTNDNVL